MTKTFKSLISSIEQLKQLPESVRSEYFDTILDPLIAKLREKVENTEKPQPLNEWLYVQYATMNFALEGVTELTYQLLQTRRKELFASIKKLPLQQRVGLQALFDELEGKDSLAESRSFLSAMAFEEQPVETLESVSNVRGRFTKSSTFTSSRGYPVVHGTLELFTNNGSSVPAYSANSGGGSPDYKTRNGPVPPGIYRVSNHRANRTTTGMVLNEIGFSLDLDPTDGTQVFGRTLFRIHPDGLSAGTNGCIGVREPKEKLQMCEKQIVQMLRQGAFKIEVRH